MPPSKEDILLTYLGKRDANRNLSNTPKPDENLVYKAPIENYSYKAGKWIVVIVILSFIMTLFAGIGSLILSLFVLAVVFVYYYGIKRSLQNKQSNRTRYYCTNCNHAFVGPKPYCEECGIQLNCDRNMYKCRCCGQTFIGKRKICPHCKGKLYY